MNIWECEYRGCKHKCIGIGTAVGLRAIGWYVTKGFLGPVIYCPQHWDEGPEEAEKQAKELQEDILNKMGL